MRKRTLYFVTGNKHKLEEVANMIGPGFELKQITPMVPEIRSDDIEEIAKHKVFSVGKRGAMVMADDSGLFVKALSGFPGTYSAYAHEKLGCDGILKLMKDKRERCGEFRSAIALLTPDGKVRMFTGAAKGLIAKRKLGKGGFAFDPIFIPKGRRKSFGQMDTDEKNAISHRGRAFRKLTRYLLEKLS